MSAAAPARLAETIACVRCGDQFQCDPAGDCWCKARPLVHAVPMVPAGCFCPRCLDDGEKPEPVEP